MYCTVVINEEVNYIIYMTFFLGIRTTDWQIWILLFSSEADKMPTKKSKFFSLLLLKVQTHTDPADPDPNP
jgi:hypothetical protein